jgi:hypothetical protein
MNFFQIVIIQFGKEINVGGMGNVPPAPCLPAACVSACAAARAGLTGSARTKDLKGSGTVRPLVEKNVIWRLESAA